MKILYFILSLLLLQLAFADKPKRKWDCHSGNGELRDALNAAINDLKISSDVNGYEIRSAIDCPLDSSNQIYRYPIPSSGGVFDKVLTTKVLKVATGDSTWDAGNTPWSILNDAVDMISEYYHIFPKIRIDPVFVNSSLSSSPYFETLESCGADITEWSFNLQGSYDNTLRQTRFDSVCGIQFQDIKLVSKSRVSSLEEAKAECENGGKIIVQGEGGYQFLLSVFPANCLELVDISLRDLSFEWDYPAVFAYEASSLNGALQVGINADNIFSTGSGIHVGGFVRRDNCKPTRFIDNLCIAAEEAAITLKNDIVLDSWAHDVQYEKYVFQLVDFYLSRPRLAAISPQIFAGWGNDAFISIGNCGVEVGIITDVCQEVLSRGFTLFAEVSNSRLFGSEELKQRIHGVDLSEGVLVALSIDEEVYQPTSRDWFNEPPFTWVEYLFTSGVFSSTYSVPTRGRYGRIGIDVIPDLCPWEQ